VVSVRLIQAAIALFLVSVAGAPLHAQTPIDITADFDIDYVLGLEENVYSGAGTIEPFGAATVSATETFSGDSTVINATFSIATGDTFSATADGATASGNECTIMFIAAAGTGIFKGATGTLNMNYTCDPGAPLVGSFHSSGPGTITTSCVRSVSPDFLTFTGLNTLSAPILQPVFVENECPQAVTFSTETNGQPWLSAPPAGSVSPYSAETFFVTVVPNVPAGTYVSPVTVTEANQTFAVLVTLIIAEPQLDLSETGFQFSAAAGAGPPPTESIELLSQGGGSLAWTASASTTSGNWLSVNPSRGVTGGSATISVDPTGLQPGGHYGLVQFSSPGAPNSPQTAVVVFHVLSAISSQLGGAQVIIGWKDDADSILKRRSAQCFDSFRSSG
jgi:Viral BACON domain